MPNLDLECKACVVSFDPFPYILVEGLSWSRSAGGGLRTAYVWEPRAGTCQDETHYPGYGEVD